MAHRLAVERDHARAVVPQPHAEVLRVVRELAHDLAPVGVEPDVAAVDAFGGRQSNAPV